MPIGLRCWTCRRRDAQCDGKVPACCRCRLDNVNCLGYDGMDLPDAVRRSGRRNEGAAAPAAAAAAAPIAGMGMEVLDIDAEPYTSDRILGSATGARQAVGIINQPTPSLYRRAQMIFEGLDYFNKMICPDLVCLETHFNPYRVNLQRVDRIPEIYVKVLVSTAGFHRLMSHGPEPTSSSALVQRDVDVFALRIEALRGLNEQLSQPEQQTSDATLLCILSLMIASIQSSAYAEWRSHLEGARRIIQMRGGLKKIITDNPYFKPVLTFFMLIDVMSATTTASTHKDMAVATTMAVRYWEIEPGVLQFMATTCMPCPDDLFRVLVLVNYLRTIMGKPAMHRKWKTGTKMAFEKVMIFSPTDYASKMQYFNGWSTNGKEVGFSPVHSPSADSPTSSASSPSTDTSRSSSDRDLWLSLGSMYRASTLLYALQTLVMDSGEHPAELMPEGMHIDLNELRAETVQALYNALAPVFSDPISMHHIGKLIMWPLFILGMETSHANTKLRDFVTNSFAILSQELGSLGPLGAIDALGVKWKIDAEAAPNGTRVTWDDYFQGREDYIVF
ncbi:fungal-specific transcription factor domain-containing protein [Xylariales sp. PMI_506]|nr:fungal-specific transcription factor domain-containing protein [Xylariales sp. PMI_506]